MGRLRQRLRLRRGREPRPWRQVHDQQEERGQRDANIGVEIMLRQGGQGLSLTAADMTIPISEVETIRSIPGVAMATPVGQNLEMGSGSGLGIRQVDGIEFDEFTKASDLRIVQGRNAAEDINGAGLLREAPADGIAVRRPGGCPQDAGRLIRKESVRRWPV